MMMKYLKLLLISLLGFGFLFWGITLLFPSVTVISRAINVVKDSSSVLVRITKGSLSPNDWLLPQADASLVFQITPQPSYRANLYNAGAGDVASGDTLFFSLLQPEKDVVGGGIAEYQLSTDSSTVQLYYVFEYPWYKPLQKMRMMVMDKAIGPGMDSALLRLKQLTMAR